MSHRCNFFFLWSLGLAKELQWLNSSKEAVLGNFSLSLMHTLQIAAVFIIGIDLLKSGTSLTEVKTLNNQTNHCSKDFFCYCNHSNQK